MNHFESLLNLKSKKCKNIFFKFNPKDATSMMKTNGKADVDKTVYIKSRIAVKRA